MVGVEPKDTTKPKSRRRKNLLFKAHFHCCGPGSTPGQGTKILQARQHSKKKKKKVNKENTRHLSQRRFSIELGQRSIKFKLYLIKVRRVNIFIPSSTWAGALVPTELKDMYQIVMQIP